MLDDFRPRTLSEVAKAVGSDPFEVMRILVRSGSVPEHLSFSDAQLESIRQALAKG
jgi:hypothetical protein